MKIIKPMEPILTEKIVDGDEWIHQIKWDGIRCICYLENKKINLFTKNGNNQTDYYPEIQKIIKLTKAKQAIIDGELIVLDENNSPSFRNILKRHRRLSRNLLTLYMQKYPVKYILFDIIKFNEIDLRNTMYEERKKVLEQNVVRDKDITITDDFNNGKQLFSLVKSKGLEGIVSKNKYSKYLSGKNHNYWYKTKVTKKMLAIVNGIKLKNNYIQSLILSININGEYKYIGSVSIGLKNDDVTTLLKMKDQLIDSNKNIIDYPYSMETVIFFKPLLTCWVSFLDRSNQSLRHAKLIGFAKNKPCEADGKEYIYER